MAAKRKSRSRSSRSSRNRTYVHLPFAYRVRRKNLYKFIATSLILIALMLFVPWIIYQFTVDADRSNRQPLSNVSEGDDLSHEAPHVVPDIESLPATPEAPESEEVSLNHILEKYRTATGMREAQSLLIIGSYTEDGRTFQMKLAAKAPNLVRKSLADGELDILCSYDGKQAKIEIQKLATGETVVTPLRDKIYETAIVLEGAFLSLADMSGELQSPLYDWQADQDYADQTCWTVVSKLPGSAQITHLIDQETGFELVRYLDLVVDGKKHQLSIHFSDFRSEQTLCLPHTYTMKVNGAIRGEARVESYQRNPGLMPWMF